MGTGIQSWKRLEKQTAEILGGTRKNRATNYAISDYDVEMSDVPFLKVDSKRRKSSTHYTLWEGIKKKYCKNEGDEAVMALRVHRKQTILITIDIMFFKKLLDVYRKYGTKTDK